jgi:2-polyprenyl-6-hydroxyphenyl methylase/3-demethylubiquinone-9 3-methyltransferase
MKKNDLEFYDVSAENWWNTDAKIYALYHLNQPRFSFFDRYVSDWKGLTALDVGCGGGFSCEFMAQRGVSVSGIDQSAKCIAKAKEHAESQNLRIDYQQGFSENLPYADNTFDIVTCVDVLEHVADFDKTVSEIHRVLKPKGIFFFDTINRTLQSKIIMILILENLLCEIPKGVHDWNKFIKPKELLKVLTNRGFGNIEIKGFDLFGNTLYQNALAYLYYKKTGGFQVRISDNPSVMYIGKAEKGTLYSSQE